MEVFMEKAKRTKSKENPVVTEFDPIGFKKHRCCRAENTIFAWSHVKLGNIGNRYQDKQPKWRLGEPIPKTEIRHKLKYPYEYQEACCKIN